MDFCIILQNLLCVAKILYMIVSRASVFVLLDRMLQIKRLSLIKCLSLYLAYYPFLATWLWSNI